jgi:hypothetical protein
LFADVFAGGVLCTLSAWVIGLMSSWLGLEPGRKFALPSGLLICKTNIMRKSIDAKPKPRRPGRPATGRYPMMGLRGSPEFRAEIEAWAARQDDTPGLSESIRRLVELGLTVRIKSKQSAATAQRAKELAAKAIDKLSDAAASDDDQATRKRRLLKGPEEFREARVDRPKTKI